jgi:hypothetical protein
VKVSKVIRNLTAAALIASVPATGAFAATRPSAAVPMAGSTAVMAQDEGQPGDNWGVYAGIGFLVLVAVWALVSSDGHGNNDPLSRG